MPKKLLHMIEPTHRMDGPEHVYGNIHSLVDPETVAQVTNRVASYAKDGMIYVEVGVRKGGHLCHLGKKLKETGADVKLFGIDKWVDLDPYYDVVVENVHKTDIEDITCLMMSDSIEASFRFEDKSVDYLFLDGEHSSPYIDKELEAWMPKMKENSILAGHDYCSGKNIQDLVKRTFGDDFYLTSNEASYVVKFGKGLSDEPID